MSTQYGVKKLFENILGVEVEVQGFSPNQNDIDRKLFYDFVETVRNRVIKSVNIEETHGLNMTLWDSNLLFAIECLLQFTMDKPLYELIMWYVYEHPFISEEDQMLIGPDEKAYPIKDGNDLYNFILLLESY